MSKHTYSLIPAKEVRIEPVEYRVERRSPSKDGGAWKIKQIFFDEEKAIRNRAEQSNRALAFNLDYQYRVVKRTVSLMVLNEDSEEINRVSPRAETNFEYGAFLLPSNHPVGIGPTENRDAALEDVIAWEKDGYIVVLRKRQIGDWIGDWVDDRSI